MNRVDVDRNEADNIHDRRALIRASKSQNIKEILAIRIKERRQVALAESTQKQPDQTRSTIMSIQPFDLRTPDYNSESETPQQKDEDDDHNHNHIHD